MLRTSQGVGRYTAHTVAPAMWWFAAGVVVLEALLALAGLATLGLAAAALIAPGYALAGLLPRGLRSRPIAQITLAPALGLAVTSIALISITQLGLPLTGVSVRLVVVALVLAGLAVPRDEPAAVAVAWRERVLPVVLDLAVLAGVCAAGLVLAWRVIGDVPVPGDDWAKYLLYADEIRRHGSLLLSNDLWMGGRPFSEDPGVPSLEGSALLMTGAPAGALVRTIVLLGLVQLVAVFGATRAWFGLLPAAAATLLLAIVPATQNILGWHGLANAGALAILALVLVQVGAWLAGDLDRRAQLGLAITIVGVVASHRFTAAFMFGALGLSILAALVVGPRKQLLIGAATTAALALPVGLLVALDLRTRAGDSGGSLPYTSYLTTKIDLTLALRDVTPLLAGFALATVIGLVALRRLPRVVWPALGMAIVAAVLAYGWVLHVPLYYSRVTFFVPLPLALLSAAGFAALAAALRGRRAVAGPEAEPGTEAVAGSEAVAGTEAEPGTGTGTGTPSRIRVAVAGAVAAALVAGAVVVFAGSWRQAEEVRQFYAFASPTSLGALDVLSTRLQPDEIVATDRCWSFLATWLLHTQTYPALEEQDIQPKAELIVARQSAAILHGDAEGRRLMRELPVRYALLDPTCPVTGARFAPPGELVFAGDRLAIIELDPAGKTPVIKGDRRAARERARERERLGG